MLGTALTCLCLALWVAAPAQTPPHAKAKAPTPTSATAKTKARSKVPPKAKARATAHRAPVRKKSEGISEARALEIQQALVLSGYLDHASGHWDTASKAAMARFQKDQHWQTRYVPDARALIALGLGPVNDQPPVQAAESRDTAASAIGRR